MSGSWVTDWKIHGCEMTLMCFFVLFWQKKGFPWKHSKICNQSSCGPLETEGCRICSNGSVGISFRENWFSNICVYQSDNLSARKWFSTYVDRSFGNGFFLQKTACFVLLQKTVFFFGIFSWAEKSRCFFIQQHKNQIRTLTFVMKIPEPWT